MILLSIIIPTYKRNDALPRAIESVLQQINQSCELIVVDDNDKNSKYRHKNIEILRKYPNVIYIKHQKNKNGAAARNTGIKHARGEFITFLDDDDEFLDGRIEALLNVIQREKPDFICTGYIYRKNGKTVQKQIPDIEIRKSYREKRLLEAKSFFGTGSNIVCRRILIDKIGGFDERFVRNQDIEFMIRYLKESQKIRVIPQYLVVKNLDSTINVPNFEKALATKQIFLNTFDSEIKKYDIDTQKTIVASHYYELLGNAIKKQDWQEYKKVIKLLKQRKIYSIKRIIALTAKGLLRQKKIAIIIMQKIRGRHE